MKETLSRFNRSTDAIGMIEVTKLLLGLIQKSKSLKVTGKWCESGSLFTDFICNSS